MSIVIHACTPAVYMPHTVCWVVITVGYPCIVSPGIFSSNFKACKVLGNHFGSQKCWKLYDAVLVKSKCVFYGLFSRTTWVSRHYLDHVEIISTWLQTDNHVSTLLLNFFTGQMLFLMPSRQCQSAESNDVVMEGTGIMISFKFDKLTKFCVCVFVM